MSLIFIDNQCEQFYTISTTQPTIHIVVLISVYIVNPVSMPDLDIRFYKFVLLWFARK